MRKVKFAEGEYYHIYNRGVEKRNIFLNGEDYKRFILGLIVFNNQGCFSNIRRIKLQKYNLEEDEKYFVEIVCYCLMPNHYHLVLCQKSEYGISKFMHRVGTGYAKYFNEKNKRNGVLFQGRFKAVHINSDEYLLHLSRYIHLNPLDLLQKDWKEKGLKNRKSAIEYLKNYEWSSLSYYLDFKKDALPSIDSSVITDQFSTPGAYSKFISEWIETDKELISDLLLE